MDAQGTAVVESDPDGTGQDRTGEDTERRPWHPVTKVAFRFCVIYLSLFCLLFSQILFTFTGVIGLWMSEQAVLFQMVLLEPVTTWVGRHVFGVDAVLHRNSGSGDQTVIWLLVFCIVVVSVVACAVWTLLDRRRIDYSRLAGWFLLFIRLCLGGQMIFYGVAKVIPTQMPAPPLSALLRPFGDLSPASVLWLQIGSSYPYEMMLGAVELVAGLLLFVLRTATLGALLSLLGTAQIFMMNMSYDVPVKLLSFHLLLMSLVLLAPQARRLANMLVLQRPAAPAVQPPVFSTRRANRIAATVQIALGIWVMAGCLAFGWQGWYEYGGGRPTSELHGIWSVTEFTRDGAPVPPLTTDENRWQRIIFENPGALTYQGMDGALTPVPAQIDADARTLVLTTADGAPTGAGPHGEFTFQRPEPDQLRLDGQLDGHRVTMSLHRVDPDSFTLRNRGFNWIQEYPFFR